MLVAELEQPATAVEAVARLERAWLVVEAGVDDAAVVTGLMLRQASFRFQHHDRDVLRRGKLECRRQAEDAAADNGDVETRRAHRERGRY